MVDRSADGDKCNSHDSKKAEDAGTAEKKVKKKKAVKKIKSIQASVLKKLNIKKYRDDYMLLDSKNKIMTYLKGIWLELSEKGLKKRAMMEIFSENRLTEAMWKDINCTSKYQVSRVKTKLHREKRDPYDIPFVCECIDKSENLSYKEYVDCVESTKVQHSKLSKISESYFLKLKRKRFEEAQDTTSIVIVDMNVDANAEGDLGLKRKRPCEAQSTPSTVNDNENENVHENVKEMENENAKENENVNAKENENANANAKEDLNLKRKRYDEAEDTSSIVNVNLNERNNSNFELKMEGDGARVEGAVTSDTDTGLVDVGAEDAMCGLHLLSAIAEDLDSREVWSVSIQAKDMSNNEVKQVDNIHLKQFVPSFCTLIKEYLAPAYQDGISFDIKLIQSNETDRRKA